jgi:hypothetical protein
MKMTRGAKTVLRTLAGIAVGFIARSLLDALMGKFPGEAHQIDVIGQFLTALVIGWFCLIPILEDYGVIRRSSREK